MGYTKGPWKLNNLGEIININGECVAAPCEPGITFPNDADIPMILSAPDLYEALKAIEYDGEPGEICCPYCETHLGKGHDKNCVIGNALSKAEGRT